MSDAAAFERSPVPVSRRGPAPKRTVTGFGFGRFLLVDIIISTGLFAVYPVLPGATDGGLTGLQIFDRHQAFFDVCFLVAFRIACGFVALAVERREAPETYAVAILGAAFRWMEVAEFMGLARSGHRLGRRLRHRLSGAH